jgi:hypothetical protein
MRSEEEEEETWRRRTREREEIWGVQGNVFSIGLRVSSEELFS